MKCCWVTICTGITEGVICIEYKIYPKKKNLPIFIQHCVEEILSLLGPRGDNRTLLIWLFSYLDIELKFQRIF